MVRFARRAPVRSCRSSAGPDVTRSGDRSANRSVGHGHSGNVRTGAVDVTDRPRARSRLLNGGINGAYPRRARPAQGHADFGAGRSSDSRAGAPEPSHRRNSSKRNESSRHARQWQGGGGSLSTPGHSGGAVPDSHRIPCSPASRDARTGHLHLQTVHGLYASRLARVNHLAGEPEGTPRSVCRKFRTMGGDAMNAGRVRPEGSSLAMRMWGRGVAARGTVRRGVGSDKLRNEPIGRNVLIHQGVANGFRGPDKCAGRAGPVNRSSRGTRCGGAPGHRDGPARRGRPRVRLGSAGGPAVGAAPAARSRQRWR